MTKFKIYLTKLYISVTLLLVEVNCLTNLKTSVILLTEMKALDT